MSITSFHGTVNVRPEESILGIGYKLLIDSAATGGTYELMLFVVPAGAGPPPHVHSREDELFHIVEGQFEVLRGDETMQLSAGDFVSLPRNVVHAFRNTGSGMARFLCWVTPGNLRGFFDAFKRAWPADNDTPSPPDEEDIARLMAAAAKHGIEIGT